VDAESTATHDKRAATTSTYRTRPSVPRLPERSRPPTPTPQPARPPHGSQPRQKPPERLQRSNDPTRGQNPQQRTWTPQKRPYASPEGGHEYHRPSTTSRWNHGDGDDGDDPHSRPNGKRFHAHDARVHPARLAPTPPDAHSRPQNHRTGCGYGTSPRPRFPRNGSTPPHDGPCRTDYATPVPSPESHLSVTAQPGFPSHEYAGRVLPTPPASPGRNYPGSGYGMSALNPRCASECSDADLPRKSCGHAAARAWPVQKVRPGRRGQPKNH